MFLKHRKKLVILVAIMIMAVTTGLGCKGGDLGAQKELEKQITLEVWGVFDDGGSFNDLINAYKGTRINVNINYRKLQFEEYEQALLEAWAEGRGPDIFMMHNTWTGGYVNKIKPPPEEIKVVAANVTGGYNKKIEAYYEKYASASPESIRNDFVSAVEKDAVRDGVVYALPLSVDTLALYYNRALLDQAGVPSIPKTWQEVKEASQALTIFDSKGDVSRSGIALGGADNINRSFDILSLLMAQNGTVFTSPDGKSATFAKASPFSSDRKYVPAEAALQFYADFANPGKEVYTWSEDLPSAQESFISGNLAMMLGYSYQLPLLRAQGPSVDVAVAPVPHINSNGTDATGATINWANYWLLTVAQSSENPEHAWDFIHFATTKPNNARLYLEKTSRPAALRSLIAEQLAEPELGVFANQLLTAQSWYTGNRAMAAENIFKDMIQRAANAETTAADAIKQAEGLINQTLR